MVSIDLNRRALLCLDESFRQRDVGHEIEYPMAIVILGGLVTSTAVNLFLVPTLYLRFGRGRHLTPRES